MFVSRIGTSGPSFLRLLRSVAFRCAHVCVYALGHACHVLGDVELYTTIPHLYNMYVCPRANMFTCPCYNVVRMVCVLVVIYSYISCIRFLFVDVGRSLFHLLKRWCCNMLQEARCLSRVSLRCVAGCALYFSAGRRMRHWAQLYAGTSPRPPCARHGIAMHACRLEGSILLRLNLRVACWRCALSVPNGRSFSHCWVVAFAALGALTHNHAVGVGVYALVAEAVRWKSRRWSWPFWTMGSR